MRPPERIPVLLDLLREIWIHYPDMRFLQLIYVLQSKFCHENHPHGMIQSVEKDGFQRTGYDLFNIEDSTFHDFLIRYLEELNESV